MNAPPKIKGKDIERFWMEPPPEPSARCRWWQARIEAGWQPSR